EEWFRARANRWAAAVFELKKWVLSPMPDTYHHFIDRIASMLVQVIEGTWDRWDSFDMPATNPAARRRVWLVRTGTATRVLIVTFTPAVLLIILQHSRYALSGPAATSAGLIAFAWVGITLLTTLDPAYSGKIAVLKDLTGIAGGSVSRG